MTTLNHSFKTIVFISALLLFFGTVTAADDAGKTDLDQKSGKTVSKELKYHLVVSATRTPQPKVELASSTTLITAKELKKTGKRNVVEALAAAPGLDVLQNGGAGTRANVFIRGANTEHTLVMLDGVELNDPSSPGRTYDLGNLSLDNIDRIEVVRGPQSTLYGSDAMGGVINIITKKGTGKPRFSLSAEAGSYGTFKEAASLTGGTEAMNYSVGVSRFDTKGFSNSHEKYGNTEKDGYGNTSISASLGMKARENLDFRLTTRFSSSKSDLDNSAGVGGDDPNYTADSKEFLLSGEAKLSLLKGKWEQRLGVSYNNINREYDNGTDEFHPMDSSDSFYKGNRFKVDWQHNVNLHPTNTVTAGFEYEREQGESEYNWVSAWGPGQSLFPKKSANHLGVYLQDNIKIEDILFMTLGIRIDDHNRFGTRATYRIAPAVLLPSGTKFKATYGTGFKAPSLYHLYAPATMFGPIGNENLEPEKSTGWDVGIEQFLFEDRLTFSVTYFRNDFEDLILYDWALGYVNVDKAETKGLEVMLTAFPIHNLSFKASYTLTDTKNKETGEQLLRRPKHKANFTINYRFPGDKLNINLNVAHIGKRSDYFPYPTLTIADPYTLVNMSASFRLNKNLEIFGRIDNLLNEKYEAIMGYGTPERSIYGGVRYNY